MIDARLESMESRLQRLEHANEALARRCRRWKQAAATALVGTLAVVITGAASLPGLIEASQFVLRDKAGRMRAALTIRPDGTPGLGFFDEGGRPRLSFDISPKGESGVNIMDATGRPQAALAIRPDGTPGLGLFDPLGRVALSLDVDAMGRSGVNLYGEDGRLRAALAIRPDGTPGLGIFDGQGNVRNSVEDQPDAPAARQAKLH
jgi:hypothetical protein